MGHRRNPTVIGRPASLLWIALAVVVVVISVAQRARGGAERNVPAELTLVRSSGQIGGNLVVDSFSAFVLRRDADGAGVLPSIDEGLRLLRRAVAAIQIDAAPYAAAARAPEHDTAGLSLVEAPLVNANVQPGGFRELADAIARLQRERFAHLARAAAQLQRAAADIRDDVPLSLQTMAIERYFERASDVLRGMAGMKP